MKKPAAPALSRHVVELCTPHRLSGSTSSSLDIAINDRRIGAVQPGLPRADLLAAGFPSGRGFDFTFDQSLWTDDEVSLQTGRDVDLHCNVFTPQSFVHVLQCLDRCERLGFDPLSVGYRGDDEFTAHLRK